MLSLDDALATLLAEAGPVTEHESRPLPELIGRVLAADIVSAINTPPTDISAMDGYAINSRDMVSEKICFTVSQTLAAGDSPSPLEAGTAARILTGAALPKGADTVVIQENCQPNNGAIIIQGAVAAGMNIRRCGQDVRDGDIALSAGTVFQPAHLAMLASIGLDRAPVVRRLRVAVASSGDELIPPGQPARTNGIFNSNHYSLLGQLQRLGCDIIDLGIVPDDPAALHVVLQQAATEADVIITSGGVSVGDRDFVRQAIEQLGRLAFWRIAIKPGKPLAFGRINETPVFGLPGNPVSQFVTFCLCAQPFILKQQGRRNYLPATIWAEADFDHCNNGARDEYLRATLSADDSGRNTVMKYARQDSALLSALTRSNCLAVVPAHSTVSKGQPLRIMITDAGMLT